jgi:hypothetical protein
VLDWATALPHFRGEQDDVVRTGVWSCGAAAGVCTCAAWSDRLCNCGSQPLVPVSAPGAGATAGGGSGVGDADVAASLVPDTRRIVILPMADPWQPAMVLSVGPDNVTAAPNDDDDAPAEPDDEGLRSSRKFSSLVSPRQAAAARRYTYWKGHLS